MSKIVKDVEEYSFDEFVSKYPNVYNLEYIKRGAKSDGFCWTTLQNFLRRPTVEVSPITWKQVEDDEGRAYIDVIPIEENFMRIRNEYESTEERLRNAIKFAIFNVDTIVYEGDTVFKNLDAYIHSEFVRIKFYVYKPKMEQNKFMDVVVKSYRCRNDEDY